MIHSITIDNFRGIKHLDINGFRKVNLLVGENGSGKSTVLESLLIGSYPTYPRLILGLNSTRSVDKSDWNYVFHKNENNEVTLKFNETNGIEHFLHISRYEEVNTQFETSLNPNSYYKKGMKFSYRQNGGDEYGAIIFPKEKETKMLKDFRVAFNISYLPAKHTPIFEELSDIFLQKREATLTAILQGIEPKLTQILPIDNRLYVDIDNVRLPASVMGDGFLKVLAIVLWIQKAEGGAALLDEIENGLHYSSLEVMWKAVFAAAREFNVQVFATTHSWECVGTFSEAQGLDDDDIRLFRINKIDDEMFATDYKRSFMQAAIENNIEVR